MRTGHCLLIAMVTLAASRSTMASAIDPERVVIDDNFPDAYQVEAADVNGDGKPDLIALGGGTCAWYENPSWRKRVITGPDRTPAIISSATADIDGDGKAEVAIAYDFAMNEPKRGKLLLAVQGKGSDDPWEVEHIADVGSIHRLRWYHQLIIGPNSVRFTPVFPGRNRRAGAEQDLVTYLLVAPLFGPSAKAPAFQEEPAHLLTFGFKPHTGTKPYNFSKAGGGAGIGGGGLGGSGGGFAGGGGGIGGRELGGGTHIRIRAVSYRS